MQHKRKCAYLNAICYLGWSLWRVHTKDYYRREKISVFNESFEEKFWFSRYLGFWIQECFCRIGWKLLRLWRNQDLGLLDVTLCRWVVFLGVCREGQCVHNEKLRDTRRMNTSFLRVVLWILTYRKMTLLLFDASTFGELNVLELPYISEKLGNTSVRKAE
jgi:hypothetical protein